MWTEDQIATVVKLAKDCRTANYIGFVVNKSRNSVIGLCYRQNIPLNGKRKKIDALIKAPSFNKTNALIHFTPAPQKIISENSLLHANSYNCRWIIGEPKQLLICGNTIKKGQSYCWEHCLVAFNCQQKYSCQAP